LGRPVDQRRQLRLLRLREAGEDVAGDALLGPRPLGLADAEAQAGEAVLAVVLEDGLQPVVPAGASAALELEAPEGEVQLVVDHQHVLRGHLVEAGRAAHRGAGQVHVRLGEHEQQALPAQGPLANPRLELLLGEVRARLGGDALGDHETDIVPVALVLAPRVPQPADQLHYFFFSSFLAGSALPPAAGAAPCSPGLPGAAAAAPAAPAAGAAPSAGAAPGAAAAAAGAGAASSFSGAVTTAMVKFTCAFTFTPSGSLMSLMWSAWAILSGVTSASIFSGMADGSAHTSRSRRLWERMPPTATPSALPTSTSGTFTFTGSFSRTSMKSAWSSSRLTGSCW